MVTLWSVVPQFHPSAHEFILVNPISKHQFLTLAVVIFSSVAICSILHQLDNFLRKIALDDTVLGYQPILCSNLCSVCPR